VRFRFVNSSIRQSENSLLPSRITGFHQDSEGHWVAELECGHTQHMRHQPPWTVRPWVLTQEGRDRFIGTPIECRLCEQKESG
jgi:hypothetical protein